MNVRLLIFSWILILPFSLFGQDMKKARTNPLVDKPIPEGLKKVLLNDKTDEHPYIVANTIVIILRPNFFYKIVT